MLSVDLFVYIADSPYAYVWNDPVNYADSSGMLGERVGGKGPIQIKDGEDGCGVELIEMHNVTQTRCSSGEISVNTCKHNDGDWSVDTNFGNGLHNRAAFSGQEEVYNRDYGVYVGYIQGQNEFSHTITNYPATNP